jgi:hypothetical protein
MNEKDMIMPFKIYLTGDTKVRGRRRKGSLIHLQ